MNSRKLREAGVPPEHLGLAVQAVQALAERNRSLPKEGRVKPEELLREVVDQPQNFLEDSVFGPLAEAIDREGKFVRPDPIGYRTWGSDIDEDSHKQMRQACALPMAAGAALMPDAHVGYGLPIGGVLALEDAVVPYAVGVDIACRMKLSVFDLRPEELDRRRATFRDALVNGSVFGVGRGQEKRLDHPVMDADWTVTRVTREKKDVAWKQLGTSGSGNHFVEFGTLTVADDQQDLGLVAGEYVALLSHSGSRGAGAAVCDTYSSIARNRMPSRYADLGRLAWLDMKSEAGQEYWAAMNLMGEYAAANHAVIHRQIAKLLGEKPIAGVENHHNFCWLEEIDGRPLYVHRKGATPAGKGVLGVIPGSMADPAYVVRGKGEVASLNSASHGAGRAMSRTQAKSKFSWHATQKNLAERGIEVISAGADEVPGVYKRIDDVMAAQTDLVEKVARFDPKIVRMCGDDSRAED